MKAAEFWDAVHADEDLEYLGVVTVQADDVVGVRYRGEWRGLVWLLSAAAILGNAWEDLREVLTLARDARILAWQARIVGYYSNVRNWNRSKVGELRDRGRGDYGLPGEEVPLWREELPEPVLQDLLRAIGGGNRQLVCGLGEGPKHG